MVRIEWHFTPQSELSSLKGSDRSPTEKLSTELTPNVLLSKKPPARISTEIALCFFVFILQKEMPVAHRLATVIQQVYIADVRVQPHRKGVMAPDQLSNSCICLLKQD